MANAITDFLFSGSNDIESNHSESTTSTVGDIVSGTTHNQAEIVRAPQQYINNFDQELLHSIETVQVTAEAPWDQSGEDLLHLWLDAAKASSTSHKRTGYKLKSLYRKLGVSIIISTGLVFLTTSLFPCTEEDAYKYVQVSISFISLILANLSSFYNFGPKYQEHFEYEGLYMRYSIDIEEVLATDKDYRAPKDKTIVEYRERMGNLVTSAPEL